jgi:hypothetical protein
MKRLHRPDLFTWSCFDESRNVDFFSVAWIRAGGNVLIDPLTMSGHDRAHFQGLGGAALIIVTNSDHVRGAPALAQGWGATLYGPRAERDTFPLRCAHWLGASAELNKIHADVIRRERRVHAIFRAKPAGHASVILI